MLQRGFFCDSLIECFKLKEIGGGRRGFPPSLGGRLDGCLRIRVCRRYRRWICGCAAHLRLRGWGRLGRHATGLNFPRKEETIEPQCRFPIARWPYERQAVYPIPTYRHLENGVTPSHRISSSEIFPVSESSPTPTWTVGLGAGAFGAGFPSFPSVASR